MAGQHRVRRRGRGPAQLGGHVVVAAGSGEHQRRLPLHGAGQRLVGRGVAGVQGQHHVGRLGQAGLGDAAHHERGVDAQLARHPGVVLGRLLLHVHPRHVHGQTTHVGQVALGRERQVGVAAPQVHHPQRVVLACLAQVPLAPRLGDGGVQQPEELLHLAVLRLPGRLDPPLGGGDAQTDQHRVVLGEHPGLVPVVPALHLDLLGPRGGVHHRLELLRHPDLVLLGGGLHVPVGERLVEQVVHGLAGGTGLARLAEGVVGGVRLRLVVRRDLEVATRLEVDVAQLDALPAGVLPLLAA